MKRICTKEGALVIDPAMTCTAGWLKDEIKKRFNVPMKYVVYTHAHADHIGGGQVFQQDGAIIVANQRAIEPIVGSRRRPRTRFFDADMTITLGGETVKLHRVAPRQSFSYALGFMFQLGHERCIRDVPRRVRSTSHSGKTCGSAAKRRCWPNPEDLGCRVNFQKSGLSDFGTEASFPA